MPKKPSSLLANFKPVTKPKPAYDPPTIKKGSRGPNKNKKSSLV